MCVSNIFDGFGYLILGLKWIIKYGCSLFVASNMHCILSKIWILFKIIVCVCARARAHTCLHVWVFFNLDVNYLIMDE